MYIKVSTFANAFCRFGLVIKYSNGLLQTEPLYVVSFVLIIVVEKRQIEKKKLVYYLT